MSWSSFISQSGGPKKKTEENKQTKKKKNELTVKTASDGNLFPPIKKKKEKKPLTIPSCIFFPPESHGDFRFLSHISFIFAPARFEAATSH